MLKKTCLQMKKVLVLKEITHETSHLPTLRHRLIRARVIGQEPFSATNQSIQDIRHNVLFWGTNTNTRELSFPSTRCRPSK